MNQPTHILDPDDIDSPSILECKAILRGDTMIQASREHLLDAIKDRSDWVQRCGIQLDALQEVATLFERLVMGKYHALGIVGVQNLVKAAIADSKAAMKGE